MLRKTFLTLTGLLFCLWSHAETASEQISNALEYQASNDLQSELISLYGDKGIFDFTLPHNQDWDRYPVCQEPLNIERIIQRKGLSPTNRFKYRIECQTPSLWKTTVTLRPNIFLPIAIAQKRIEREHIITQDDVALQPYNIRLLSGEFTTELDSIIGMRAKKRITAGIPMTSALLSPALLVKKGEHIILITENHHIVVETTAEAMSDGSLGEIIKVKNLRSGKIISAQMVTHGKAKIAR